MTVYYLARDPRTPSLVKLLALATAAYALSPIDLIPDFIPILGYLDEIVLLPLVILLVMKLAPAEVIEAGRAKAREASGKPTSTVAAVVIVAIWLLSAISLGCWFLNVPGRSLAGCNIKRI